MAAARATVTGRQPPRAHKLITAADIPYGMGSPAPDTHSLFPWARHTAGVGVRGLASLHRVRGAGFWILLGFLDRSVEGAVGLDILTPSINLHSYKAYTTTDILPESHRDAPCPLGRLDVS